MGRWLLTLVLLLLSCTDKYYPTQIVNQARVDTLVQIDTVFSLHYDTTVVQQYDSVFVLNTVYDTVIVVRSDTVVYIDSLIFSPTDPAYMYKAGELWDIRLMWYPDPNVGGARIMRTVGYTTIEGKYVVRYTWSNKILNYVADTLRQVGEY